MRVIQQNQFIVQSKFKRMNGTITHFVQLKYLFSTGYTKNDGSKECQMECLI